MHASLPSLTRFAAGGVGLSLILTIYVYIYYERTPPQKSGRIP